MLVVHSLSSYCRTLQLRSMAVNLWQNPAAAKLSKTPAVGVDPLLMDFDHFGWLSLTPNRDNV